MDIDNSGKYSTILNIRNEGLADIGICVNPAKVLINVKVIADRAGKGELVITDISGKIIVTKMVLIARGTNIISVNINKFSPGAYFMKLTLSDDVVIRKFNKQ